MPSIRMMLRSLMLVIVAATLSSTVTLAQGIIIPEPPRPWPPTPSEPGSLELVAIEVTTEIKDQVAETTLRQTYVNTTDGTFEGEYLLPLPADVAVTDFSMTIDGKVVEGKVLSAEEARRTYEDTVRRMVDPVLLEYVGQGLLRVSIFPVPKGAETVIELSYAQTLAADDGLVRYSVPLGAQRRAATGVDATVSVTVESQVLPLRVIYSPTHAVDLERPDDSTTVATWEGTTTSSTRSFALFYSLSPEDLGASLVSYRGEDDQGTFALLLAPTLEAPVEDVVEKDVLLVLDVSGSMEGEKIEQAKEALTFVLRHLNPGDRYNIIDFSSRVRRLGTQLQPAGSLRQAERYVAELRAAGTTDINSALLTAMDQVDKERPAIIIFLTDGLPTKGVTDGDAIVASVKEAAPESVRLFAFGLGYDVDTVLLDTLSRELRGTSGYVAPGEDVNEAVSELYAQISNPVLADVELEVEGVTITETYPSPMSDLFAGQQMVVVGRYDGYGPATVTLSGTVNDEPRQFTYEVEFARAGGQDFLPRLWAMRKVGYLLNQIRLYGENQETVDQIVELSVRYGIVTPYSSFLITEPDAAMTADGRRQLAEAEMERLQEDERLRSGQGAVAQSQAAADMEMAVSPAAFTPDAGEGGDPVPLVTVGDKAFIMRDGVWYDTAFDLQAMVAERIEFASDEHFDLLEAQPQLAPYFALGQRVIVVSQGQAYQVYVEGDEPLAKPTAASTPTATTAPSWVAPTPTPVSKGTSR